MKVQLLQNKSHAFSVLVMQIFKIPDTKTFLTGMHKLSFFSYSTGDLLILTEQALIDYDLKPQTSSQEHRISQEEASNGDESVQPHILSQLILQWNKT